MWTRWALASTSIVLLLTTVILFSFESSSVPSVYEGTQRLELIANTPVTARHTTTRVAQTPEESEAELNRVTQSPVLGQPPPSSNSTQSVEPAEQNVNSEKAVPYVDKAATTDVINPLFGEEETARAGEGAFRGAGVRGFVKKRGLVPPVYFTSYTASTRRNSFEEWMTAYMHGNLVSHAPTPFPHCQVYVNHHYKFIWIKGHKVGSTSMRGPLGWLCDDHWKVPKGSNFTYCSRAVFNNNTLAIKDVKRWWKDYFVFGIVRNPYARFASAEEYIGKMVPSTCGRPTFEQTCREPYIHARLCRVRQCCWKGAVPHHYRHFMDQSTCLFTDTLLPAVDYIGEVENLDDDFDDIINEINRRRDPGLPALVNDLKKKNVHGRRLQEETSYAYRLFKQHQLCLRTVSRFFNKDFVLLDYEALDHLD